MMKLIVGLGNTGTKYDKTRHNTGFILLDKLADERGVTFKEFNKANSLVTQIGNFYLCKPLTLMNNSGDAVSKMSTFYKIPSEDTYVIHDDLDLEFGAIKLQFGRGAAGHNGVSDIITKLGTQDFWRLRVGIGRPTNVSVNLDSVASNLGQLSAADYVLKEFTPEQIVALRNIDLNEYILVEDTSR